MLKETRDFDLTSSEMIRGGQTKKKKKKKGILTWSATARASLSILDPASAIFFAALITSEEFFRGPLPLQ